MSEATFKSIILEKKRQVFKSRKANAFEVGSSSGKKRKQTYEDIAQKRQAKRQKDQVEGDVAICSKCKQRGHRSARSLLCPQGILSKAQVIRANLGDNYKAYTRKLGFDNCVSDTYHTKLQSSVIKACSTVRHLVFRAKLFVNYYVLENHALIGAPKVIFSQNFRYSIIQMVNGKRPTNSVSLPQQLLSSFDQFKRQHRSILYTEKLLPGISQCVTEACTELATSYTNNIVENFENHLLYFLRYKLQDLFMFMPKKIIGEVAKKYCYKKICKGSPTWPNTELLNNEVKLTIQHFCEPWKNMISKPVTQVELSANPGNFIPFLMSLNAELEQEHIDHKPYDVRKLPLPRRFCILPKPLFHWRFVTISFSQKITFLISKIHFDLCPKPAIGHTSMSDGTRKKREKLNVDAEKIAWSVVVVMDKDDITQRLWLMGSAKPNPLRQVNDLTKGTESLRTAICVGSMQFYSDSVMDKDNITQRLWLMGSAKPNPLRQVNDLAKGTESLQTAICVGSMQFYSDSVNYCFPKSMFCGKVSN
ncbi:hypothetical protein MFLAVUS_000409 [Mucor flavus]|uniref:Uncharacterized protein n=1 Tax=Mucor flavus TaxID=439312 RepID=A0ABP9YJM2_9FUNG